MAELAQNPAQTSLDTALQILEAKIAEQSKLTFGKVTGLPIERPPSPVGHTVEQDRGTQTFEISHLIGTEIVLLPSALKIMLQAATQLDKNVKVLTHNGKNYVVAGHHQVAALALLGRRTVNAKSIAVEYSTPAYNASRAKR